MGLQSRQQLVKAAVSSIVLVIGGAMVGCDKNETDVQAAAAIKKGDYQAAAREKQAAPMLVAIAASGAANDQYAATVPDYRKFSDQQIAISRSLFEVNRIAEIAQATAESSKVLAKYDPQPALGKVDQTAEMIKGTAAETWSPADTTAAYPTVSSLANSANKLKDKKAEVERTLASLVQKREGLADQAAQLIAQSNAEQGQKSVDLFKQASEVRRQLADLDVQIEQTKASLTPINDDLAVAQEQSNVVANSVKSMAQMRQHMEYGWRGVSAEQAKRMTMAEDIYGKDAKDPTTVVGRTRTLADQMNDCRAQASKLEQGFDGALGFAKAANTASDKVFKDLTAQKQADPTSTSVEAWNRLQVAADPSGCRYNQGVLQLASGTIEESLAILYASQSQTADAVADTAKAIGQPVPESLNVDAIKQNLTASNQKAQGLLQDANNQFQSALSHTQAASSAPLRRAATIGNMAGQFAIATSASAAGDTATAKQAMDEATSLRDSLVKDQIPLPSLPARLQPAFVAPPTPAAPAETPAAPAPEK